MKRWKKRFMDAFLYSKQIRLGNAYSYNFILSQPEHTSLTKASAPLDTSLFKKRINYSNMIIAAQNLDLLVCKAAKTIAVSNITAVHG